MAVVRCAGNHGRSNALDAVTIGLCKRKKIRWLAQNASDQLDIDGTLAAYIFREGSAYYIGKYEIPVFYMVSLVNI